MINKTMRLFRMLHSFLKSQSHFQTKITVMTTTRILDRRCPLYSSNGFYVNTQTVHRQVFTEKIEDDIEDFPLLENEQFDTQVNAKYILFKNSEDNIINELNNCTSVEGVCNTVNKYKFKYAAKHITQTVLVLHDLQSIYCTVNNSIEEPAIRFLNSLYEYQQFSDLLDTVSKHINDFDSVLLSYLLLYLHKLGISVENELMQNLAVKLRDKLIEHFSLDECSKLLRVIFTENSVRPYYICINLIPKIFNSIDEINSVDDLKNLTLCLNKLHVIVTGDVMDLYRNKIQQFLKIRKLTSSDYSTILKVLLFLNYPEWRHKNAVLVAEGILLLKNEISSLNISELQTLYEIFFKIQEPGDVLNEIQRCAAKFWQSSEDLNEFDIDAKLKLFTALLFFSSPLHRTQFQKDVNIFLKRNIGLGSLALLRKVFSYVKVSDENLCEQYWNQSVKYLEKENSVQNVVKLCQNYMHFNTDIDNYRHGKFERKIFQFIHQYVCNGDVVFPSDLVVFLTFTISYGNDKKLLESLMTKFESNISQLKAIDCLTVSQSIGLLNENNIISKSQIQRLKELLRQQTENILALRKCCFHENSILVKAAIIRNDYDNFIIDNLFTKLKEVDYMSSKMLEVLTDLFISTDNLIPEIINRCTEYVINHRSNIIGFNAEKIIFLCYHLAYHPINAEKFFQVVTDIIIRDRERLSGLAFLQSALSLCYFSKLPNFLVKQIFNVEFMDRLDNELANCYSKDKYPHRVRKTLMELNRAVCLEYPEFDIPWFHKTYVQEMEKRYKREQNYNIPIRIKEYLSEIVGNPNNISQNVVTPYGYHIDFVLSFDSEDRIVPVESEGITKKMALLLIRQYCYTRLYTHLKGKYQMKKRHLEMLGYRVSTLNINDWSNLLYSSERIEYLTNLIWPQNFQYLKNGKER